MKENGYDDIIYSHWYLLKELKIDKTTNFKVLTTIITMRTAITK